MRWLWAIAALLAVCWFTGCQGEHAPAVRPITVGPDQMTVNYLYWQVALPQMRVEEYYTVTTQIWRSQSAPLYGAPRVHIPYSGKVPAPYGPQLISTADGTNTESAPILVFWGSGEQVPDHQPIGVPIGGWLPGYVRPSDPLYLYRSEVDVESPVPVSGPYRLVDGEQELAQWTVPEGLQMLIASGITEPTMFATSLKPVSITWLGVPGAIGYLVSVEGDRKDRTGQVLRHIVWTSASRPITFNALSDYTNDLLPATARQVTMPAGIFTGCEIIRINILAHAAPFVDETTTPTLRVNSASLYTQAVVLIDK